MNPEAGQVRSIGQRLFRGAWIGALVGAGYAAGFVLIHWGILYLWPQAIFPNPLQGLLEALLRWGGFGAIVGIPLGALLQLIRRPKSTGSALAPPTLPEPPERP